MTDEIEKTVEELKTLCSKHHGNCTTYVAVENSHAARRYKLPEKFSIAATDNFVNDFEAQFGKNRLLFCS